MNFPDDLRYSSDHEWARVEDGGGKQLVRIGITDYAQDALGDVVYVEVPEVGTQVAANDKISEVESTKSVSDIYAPVAGVITEANDDLADAPERLNEDPYGEGWLCVIDPADPAELDALLDVEGYRQLVDG
jgi:glycine cleavage system H protein